MTPHHSPKVNAPKEPAIRRMENGDVVVDFGSKWCRCTAAGEVTAKTARDGLIKVRPATAEERMLALGYAAISDAKATGEA